MYARCKLGMFYVNMLTFQFLPEDFRNNEFLAFKNVYKDIVYIYGNRGCGVSREGYKIRKDFA